MSQSPASPDAPRKPSASVRIVGIGASAGGLTALEDFLAKVPPKSGMAYVVVQHLDPTQPALLAELLQRATSLAVCEAGSDMRVEANCVYVIPPNAELSVVRGVLHVAKPIEPRGMRLPINVLFSSLARDQGSSAVGVVLSGMGSDGTLGLQAIQAVGGLTVVQEPTSAQFDPMPRSAIAAGVADIVAVPADMPARILACVTRDASPLMPDAAPEGTPQALSQSPNQAFHSILSVLQQTTRHDFSLYKRSTLQRRIERRMAIHGHATAADYARFLQKNRQEVDLLFKELLIGVTSFFRDPAVWHHLLESTLPELLARANGRKKFRAWVVGCSTGEEAYSLAMVFTEAVQRLPEHSDCSLQIFASDLSSDAIAKARLGRYPAAIDADVSDDRLTRFFTRHGNFMTINKAIRDTVLFAQHDVLLDPPFTKLDILCCRNVLIYFDVTLQRRILPLFHYSLGPGGILLLGSSETVGPFNQLFAPIDSKLRLHLRQNHVGTGRPDFLAKSFPPLTRSSKLNQEPAVPTAKNQAKSDDSLQAAADHVLLQVHAPPAVVVNSAGDIVYISGHTGNYLEPAAGKANWNFHAMVRDSLRAPVAEALSQVTALDKPVHLRGLQVPVQGGMQALEITVQALHEPAALRGMMMIVFRDVAAPPKRGRRQAAVAMEATHAAELQGCRDEIQALREDTRASKEELQSANEELQSTNEELQSTNEELTTVNAEMQSKLDDLALAQSDMKNLLNSIEIAILFLDQNLNVRRYTDRAARIINLRESDVGRPLSDLTTSLQYPTLNDDATETLRTLVYSEKQIQTSDQRWFSVRIMPYRRLDNVIDGAVVTFVDITATKQLESRLRQDQDA
jgi:two-component system CheB/CheR fusion protein